MQPEGRPSHLRQPRPNYGRFSTEREVLAALVERFVEALDPEAIFLFGSRARGDATPWSDFDLLLIARSEHEPWARDPARAYAPVRGLGIGCDVIPCPRDVFEREKNERTGVCRTVRDEGRLLYGRDNTKPCFQVSRERRKDQLSSSSRALASLRSGVSKPSVNQP